MTQQTYASPYHIVLTLTYSPDRMGKDFFTGAIFQQRRNHNKNHRKGASSEPFCSNTKPKVVQVVRER